MSIEERILNIAEAPNWYDSRELRAIALEVRKREDRIKQLEDRIHRASMRSSVTAQTDMWRVKCFRFWRRRGGRNDHPLLRIPPHRVRPIPTKHHRRQIQSDLHFMPKNPPVLPTRINTLEELYQAAQAKKAVTAGWIHRKPTPAAWVLSYQGHLIHQLLKDGIYLYTKPTP